LYDLRDITAYLCDITTFQHPSPGPDGNHLKIYVACLVFVN